MLLKKGFVFAGCFAAFLSLAACGDDDSDFAVRTRMVFPEVLLAGWISLAITIK